MVEHVARCYQIGEHLAEKFKLEVGFVEEKPFRSLAACPGALRRGITVFETAAF
jgi:hypothetical protein